MIENIDLEFDDSIEKKIGITRGKIAITTNAKYLSLFQNGQRFNLDFNNDDEIYMSMTLEMNGFDFLCYPKEAYFEHLKLSEQTNLEVKQFFF